MAQRPRRVEGAVAHASHPPYYQRPLHAPLIGRTAGMSSRSSLAGMLAGACVLTGSAWGAEALTMREVEGQPLAANVQRVVAALEYIGAPLAAPLRTELLRASQARDAQKLQALLDPQVLLEVNINPEARVKVARGPAPAALQQGGYTPVLLKVVNESGGTQRLRIGSPQAGPVYAGMSKLSGDRMHQQHLRENENTARSTDRFLEVEILGSAPMTANLSGLAVEYAVALIYATESGRREATLTMDAGQGTQDLGFRAELPVLFAVKPAVGIRLAVRDQDRKSVV